MIKSFHYIKEEDMLYTSEQTIEMSKLYTKALSIFTDDEATKRWFITPNCALGNQIPIGLINTSFGLKMVSDVLGRIEYGVYS